MEKNQYTEALLKLAEMVTTKGVVSGTPTATYGHGPGGLLSYPGMSRPVFNAMVLPHLGLQGALPIHPSMDANPLYAILTGVTATTGSEPNGVCDDPPTVGLAKLCTHTQVFARMARQTKVYELDRVGLWTNRGEFGDLQMQGNPFQARNPNMPNGTPDMNGMLRGEVQKAMFEFAVAWSRDFAQDIYTGNPTNNTAGGGRKYYNGLDILINTGRRDAITGQACSAADSIVESFGGVDISAGGAAATAIVRTMVDIFKRLRYLATGTGLTPVRWVIAMRWSLFYELTAVWPCAYQTYRCNFTATESGQGNSMNHDRNAMTAMTNDMRGDMDNYTGQYLLIDNVRVPVILDDGIVETVMPGESFRSDLYIVPLTVLGGTQVTYMDYVNYDAPYGAMEAAKYFAPDGFYSTSDGGRFLWHKKLPNNYCVQLMAKSEPRLMLLTPQLAARLTDIQYTPRTHERSFDPNSSYFKDGGRTDYDGYPPSFYSPTNR